MYSKNTKFYLLPIIIFFQFAFVEQTFSEEHQCHKIYSSGLSLTRINENSDQQTHEVAKLLPRMIDRGDGELVAFYDLEGNVSEWLADWKSESGQKLMGGVDPEGPKEGKLFFRITKGGNWSDGFEHFDQRLSSNPLVNYDTIGFRLVRTRASGHGGGEL